MYRLIRVYNDGTVIEGKVLYHDYVLEELASLFCNIKTITYEFSIAFEGETIDEDEEIDALHYTTRGL